jgi:5-methylcytosine-specific restriction protein A
MRQAKRLCPRHRAIYDPDVGCPKCKASKQRQPDTRPSAAARGYDHRWEKASRLYRDANPLCVLCAERGLVVAAECVDHIIPHNGDASLLWSQSNWQSLCRRCHAAKTGRERRERNLGGASGLG